MKRKKTTEKETPADEAVNKTESGKKQSRKKGKVVKRAVEKSAATDAPQSRSVKSAGRTVTGRTDTGKGAPAVEEAASKKGRVAERAVVAPATGRSKPARSTGKKSTAKKGNAAPAQATEKPVEVPPAREPATASETEKKKPTHGKKSEKTMSAGVRTAGNKGVKRKITGTTPTNARGTAGSGGNTNLGNEAERRRKIKATLAILRAEPGWKEFLAEQREVLLRMREELLPNMHSVTQEHLRSGASNVASSSGQHIGDAGSEAEQRDITILRLDKDRGKLYEIEAAIERIDKGTYGVCEISLEPIPRKRLQVQPFCRLTVKCQEEYEKKYGVFSPSRNKENDDVGFSGLQKVIESTILLDEDEE